MLLAYNQEAFVRDAVRSVLAQDFEPLEIILSDDCSTDRTFEIIEAEASAYKGPHSVILNRNEENSGTEHINKLQQMARGTILVTGHGDDLSMPQRTRRLVAAMSENDVSLVSSNAEVIDAEANILGLSSRITDSTSISLETLLDTNWNAMMLGASFALRREVCTEFPAMNRKKMPFGGWDHVAPFRAGLLKGMYYLAEPLIHHRQHGGNMGNFVVDKTVSDLAFLESSAAHDVNSLLYKLEDLIQFRRQADDEKRLEAVQKTLVNQIFTWVVRWRDLRNGLILDGQRPTWVDKATRDAKPLSPNLMNKPQLPIDGTD
jgi:hypothetical protein